MKRAIRAACAVAIALAVAVLAMAPGALTAQAAEPLTLNPQAMWERFTYDGVRYAIGATMRDANGDNVYCIEAGIKDELSYERAEPIGDSPEARRIAWLTDRHRDDHDTTTQIAIGALIHDHFEATDRPLWQARRAALLAERPDVEARMNELWAQASAATPQRLEATFTLHPGSRSGVVRAIVRNGDGAPVSGVPFTIRLDGPAVFDANGAAEISGVSSDAEQPFAWTASGQGAVTARTTYDHAALRRLISRQDFASFGGQTSSDGDAVSFDVRREFQPTLRTEVTAKIIEPGSEVRDAVTSGVAPGDDWAPGTAIDADGYYFDGLNAADLANPVRPNDGESAKAFLARLAAMGRVPQAYGSARFDGDGQRVEVTAMTQPHGGEAYRARGGFGTWVWVVERDAQPQDVAGFLRGDVVTPFLEAAETNSVTHPVAVESTVTEHSAVVGSEISDRIAVSGFPDDHGSFAGDEAFGFGPDRATATVSVYWAGDRDDPSRIDDYRPQDASPPAEDEYHRLIGSWEYPAVNGEIRVGGGSPDAHGNAVTIVAEDPGWYVFVYAFAGDSRVRAVSSAYDDAWERVRVTPSVPPTPSLTTSVQPATVGVGESMRDAADIAGQVPQGAYVTFSAYAPVGFGEQAGDGMLLDEARVELDPAKANQTVLSPEARAWTNGYVQWKATLWSADGEVIDSHPLGIDGEVTEVVGAATLATRARELGAVNEPIWDEITVTPGTRDGRAVNVPQGSRVIVHLYRNTGDPAAGTLVATRAYELTDAQVRDANGADGLTFRAEGFSVAHAGEYFWVGVLEDRYGTELARGRYGEPSERTSVHRYATTVRNTTVARPLDRYESSRHSNADVLAVTAWERADGDVAAAPGRSAQSATMRWQLWRQSDGDVSEDRMVRQSDIMPMPDLPFDDDAGRLADAMSIESPDWSIDADWPEGTYYYRLHIIDANGDTVAYLPPRDPDESFDVVSLRTQTPRSRWFGAERVHDTVTLTGRFGEGMTYEAQLWRQGTSIGDRISDALAGSAAGSDEQVATTGRVTVAPGAGERTFDAPSMPAPAPGQYYWKVLLYDDARPDEPLVVDGSRLADESFVVLRVTTTASGGDAVPLDAFDTALIEGGAPEGSTIAFELFRVVGDDARDDESVAKLDPVPVEPGAERVESGRVTIEQAGDYYWRETLRDRDGTVLHVGAARVPDESVTASEAMPVTGMSPSVAVAFVLASLAACAGFAVLAASRRRTHR